MSTGGPDDPAPPAAPAAYAPGSSGRESEVIRHVAAAAGWMQLMAVLGFVTVGLMSLLAVVVTVVGLPRSGPAAGLVGVLYLAIAVAYLIPVLPLNKAAGLAGGKGRPPSYDQAIESLRQQANFWRRLGILSIVGAAISILSLIGALILGILAQRTLGS